MSAIYYDQESEIKVNQCKTIVTFDNTPKSKILDASNILIQFTNRINRIYKNHGLLLAKMFLEYLK